MQLQIVFVSFLIIMLIVFQLSGSSVRKYVLLFGSFAFIVVEGGITGLVSIIAISAITWLTGKFMCNRQPKEREHGSAEKAAAFAAITILAGILLGWKHFPWIMSRFGWDVITGDSILLIPVGLSFYTFQAISYIADIYRGEIIPAKSLADFFLYMCWFPKWMSGPIERAGTFMNQLRYQGNIRAYSFHRIAHASTYIVWGMFLKLLIADKAAVVVDFVYNDIQSMGEVVLLAAAVLYSVQIYCDFAGYTYIAMGISKLFGIDLTDNFRTPYMSENITDFWRRWHRSLSMFLRDYVYIPLGGGRKGTFRKYISTAVVFLICGIWHGVGLSFVAWGLLHALFSVISGILVRTRAVYLVKGSIGRVITFVCVTFAWIFFRAPSLTTALVFTKSMLPIFNPNPLLNGAFGEQSAVGMLGTMDIGVLVLGMLILAAMDYYAYKKETVPPLLMMSGLSDNRRLVLSAAVFAIILIFGEYGSGAEIRQFVYMNF